MKKSIFVIIIIIQILLLFIPSFSIAGSDETNTSKWENFWSIGAGFLKKGEEKGEQINTNNFKDEIEPMAKVLVIVAFTVLLVAILVIGIKYMVATPESQADLKKKLIGLFIATGIVGGAYTIWVTVYNFIINLEQNLA